jgi:nucleotide-binding universal stress UspA family protein
LEYRNILGATDFSEHGDVALRRAAELAAAGDARLIAFHVLPEPEAPSPLLAHYDVELTKEKIEKAKADAVVELRARIPEALRQSGLEIEYLVSFGDPASEILEADAKHHPDLIVVSTHGRRGWQRWIMGSVAERVLQMAKADVLAVRRRKNGE